MRVMTGEQGESLEGRSDVIPAPPIDVVSLGGQLVELARENGQLASAVDDQPAASLVTRLGMMGYSGAITVTPAPRKALGVRATQRIRNNRRQPLSEAISFKSDHAHGIGVAAVDRGLGREMLRGMLDAGLDLSELEITQTSDGDWHVELTTDPVDPTE